MFELNKIYNQEASSMLKQLPDNFATLTVTSPPYNMRLRVRNGQYAEREKAEHFSKKYANFDDALQIDDFYALHKGILSELLRVSNVVAYNFQIVTGSKEAFFRIMGDFCKEIKDVIVWDKGFGQPAMHEKVLNSSYELILILESDGAKGRVINNATFDRGSMQNIIRINREQHIDGHAATMPEKLADILIRSFSNKGDIVLDPFMGVGTTGKVAIANGRRYIGSEISSEYCDIANKRLERVQGSLF